MLNIDDKHPARPGFEPGFEQKLYQLSVWGQPPTWGSFHQCLDVKRVFSIFCVLLKKGGFLVVLDDDI